MWKFWKKNNEPADFYHPKERRIYSYHDGGKMVIVDPMLLYKKLMEVSADLSVDMKVANSQSKDARKAHDAMIKRLRDVFEIKSFAEGGLTEVETLDLMDHFLSYIDDVKKNSSTSQTSSKETPDLSNSSLAENPPSPNSSGSGSTGIEQPIGAPMPSQ